MGIDIAAIGIEYRTDGLEKGTRALRDNEKQANKTADAADGLTASIKRQSKSSLDHVHESERLIAKLKRQAETFGMTEAQIRRYEIAQMRGTAAQQKAVAHYVKHIEAVEALANAKRSATIAVASFAAAVPAVAGAFAALAKSQINAIDRFNDLNDATGASIENISALDRVARQNGSSFDTVSSVLVKFNSVLSKTDEDSDNAARVLKALGLNAEELKRIDPAESLHRTAVALSRFADDGNKARAAQILFGRSIAEVAPFMRDLSEQTKLMGVVSTQAARDAEEMNKTLFELKANTQDLARAISLGLAPAISSLSDEFSVGMNRANGFWDAILTFGAGINPFRAQAANMQALRDELVQLGAARDRYLRSGSDTRGIDDAIRQSQRQLDYLKELQARQVLRASSGMDASDAVSRRFGLRTAPSLEIPGKPKSGIGSVRDPFAEATRYFENLQRQLDKTRELTSEETTLAEIRSGRIGKVSAAMEKQLLSTARLIDLQRAEKDSLKASEQAATDAASAAGRLVEESMRYAREVEEPFEKLQRQLKELESAVESNPLIEAETAARLGTKYWQEYLKSLEVVNKELNQFDDFSKRAAQNIQDSIGQGLVDLMEGNFDNIGDSFVRMLNRMVAEAIAADVSRYLFGSMVRGGSGSGALMSLAGAAIGAFGGTGAQAAVASSMGGDSMSNMISLTKGFGTMSANGNAFGPDGVIPFANGGIVNEPTLFKFARGTGLMGEAGPEAIMPLKRGSDGKLGVSGGGNTVNVNVNQSFAAGTSRTTINQAAAAARLALERAGRNL